VLTQILLISFCGGLFCLDRVFIQAMISRPVIIAPLAGLLLGNIYAGLIIGAFIELVWIDRVPIGTYVPPNDSIAAVLATSVAVIAGQKIGGVFPQLIALSILIAIPFGILAKYMDIYIIKTNEAMSDRALEEAKNNQISKIKNKVFWGLAKVFLFTSFYLLIIQIIIVPSVMWIYPLLPEKIMTTLLFANYFLPLLGIAVAINTFKLRGAVPVFCAVFLIAAALMEYFHVR
jgi:PTS system mannose-specific IIC component